MIDKTFESEYKELKPAEHVIPFETLYEVFNLSIIKIKREVQIVKTYSNWRNRGDVIHSFKIEHITEIFLLDSAECFILKIILQDILERNILLFLENSQIKTFRYFCSIPPEELKNQHTVEDGFEYYHISNFKEVLNHTLVQTSKYFDDGYMTGNYKTPRPGLILLFIPVPKTEVNPNQMIRFCEYDFDFHLLEEDESNDNPPDNDWMDSPEDYWNID